MISEVFETVAKTQLIWIDYFLQLAQIEIMCLSVGLCLTETISLSTSQFH